MVIKLQKTKRKKKLKSISKTEEEINEKLKHPPLINTLANRMIIRDFTQ